MVGICAVGAGGLIKQLLESDSVDTAVSSGMRYAGPLLDLCDTRISEIVKQTRSNVVVGRSPWSGGVCNGVAWSDITLKHNSSDVLSSLMISSDINEISDTSRCLCISTWLGKECPIGSNCNMIRCD